ncbi:MAG: hypothetical protein ACR2QM_08195 [Longimicrobiales bacterium]
MADTGPPDQQAGAAKGPLQLRLLGRIDLFDPDGRTFDALLTRRKPFALFAYLALAKPTHYLQRDSLCALFWPESDQERARASLRQALAVIRREVPDVLEQRGDDEVRLAVGSVQSDVDRLRAAAADGDGVSGRAAYGGPFMEGFHLSGSHAFEEWHDSIASEVQKAKRALPDVDDTVVVAPRGPTLEPVPETIPEAVEGGNPEALIEPVPTSQGRHRLLLAGATALALLTVAWVRTSASSPQPVVDIARVAVLTPNYVGANEAMSSLAIGLQHEIISDLFRASGVSAVPAASLSRLENQGWSPQEVAMGAGATHVLESSIQDEAGRLFLRFSLSHTLTDSIVWTRPFDRSTTDLIDVRLAVAQQIAAELGSTLANTTVGETGRFSDEVMEDFYIAKGLGQISGTEQSAHERWEEAVQRLGGVVERAPTFARAWAELAMTHYQMYWLNTDPSAERVALGDSALAKAELHGPAEYDTRWARANRDYYIEARYERVRQITRGLLAERDLEPDLLLLHFAATRRSGDLAGAAEIMEARLAERPYEIVLFGSELENTYKRLRRYSDARRIIERREELQNTRACVRRVTLVWAETGSGDLYESLLAECPQRLQSFLRHAFWTSFRSRRFDDALAVVDTLRGDWMNEQTAPFPVDFWLAQVFMATGRDAELPDLIRPHLPELERLVDEMPNLSRRRQFLAWAYAFVGDRDRALAASSVASQVAAASGDYWADIPKARESEVAVHMLLGDTDRAVELMEKNVAEGYAIPLGEMRSDPLYDPLRGLPAFEALLAQMERAVDPRTASGLGVEGVEVSGSS